MKDLDFIDLQQIDQLQQSCYPRIFSHQLEDSNNQTHQIIHKLKGKDIHPFQLDHIALEKDLLFNLGILNQFPYLVVQIEIDMQDEDEEDNDVQSLLHALARGELVIEG
jgi:hypothetical protein